MFWNEIRKCGNKRRISLRFGGSLAFYCHSFQIKSTNLCSNTSGHLWNSSWIHLTKIKQLIPFVYIEQTCDFVMNTDEILWFGSTFLSVIRWSIVNEYHSQDVTLYINLLLGFYTQFSIWTRHLSPTGNATHTIEMKDKS